MNEYAGLCFCLSSTRYVINIFQELEVGNSNKEFILFWGHVSYLESAGFKYLSLSASINSSLLSGDKKINNMKTIFPLINRCIIDKETRNVSV